MTNSISSVSSVNHARAMDKVTKEQMYDPGLYAMRNLLDPPPPYKKEGGFFSFLGKLIVTAGIVCGGAVAARKLIPALKKETLDVTKDIAKEAKFVDKAKYYIAKFADKIENVAKTFVAKFKTGVKEGTEAGSVTTPSATP